MRVTDHIWKRNEVDSPCVKVCVVHPDARICVGCYRTIEEIGGWNRMSNEDRAALKEELPGRASQLRNHRRVGRKRRRG